MTVARSVFETLPWPGIFIYNVTEDAAVVRSEFKEVASKALVAKTGEEERERERKGERRERGLGGEKLEKESTWKMEKPNFCTLPETT